MRFFYSHPLDQSQAGFTLVELIVSLALFTVVVTTSVGALLMLVASNDQLQKEQSVMTNLSFALDSMAREIRTGIGYFCDSKPNENPPSQGSGSPANRRLFQDGSMLSGLNNFQDCSDGNSSSLRLHGLSVIESGGSITGGDTDTRIVYFFDEAENDIFRRVEGGNRQSITSSDISIENAEFFVTGSEPRSANPSADDQASVTIVIEAREASNPTGKVYRIQTTITQRTLDI